MNIHKYVHPAARRLPATRLLAAFTVMLAPATMPVPASAQTWTGASGASDTNWSNSGNWTDAIPANDGTADIIFDATATGISTVNAEWSVASLLFNNTGPLTLTGSDLTIRRTTSGGNWVNSAANNATKRIENNLNLVYDNVGGGLNSSLGAGNGGLAITGNITLSTTGAATPTSIILQLRGAGTNSISGNIQFDDTSTPAQRTLAKTDAGTWTVGGTDNNFTGVTINHGILKFASSAALPSTVQLGFSATSNGFNPTLDLNGQNLTVASLTAIKPASNTNTRSRVTGTGTLSVNGLISANDLNGGWLEINATVDSATGVTIAANSGLAGTGAITLAENGNIQISGNLTPGTILSASGTYSSTAGTLTFGLSGDGKLTFAANSSLKFDLGATDAASDKIAFATTGDWLSGSGSATLDLTAVGGTDAGIDYGVTYTIFRNVSTTGFVFASITGYDAENYIAQLTQVGTDYQLSFASTAVPEPAHLAALLAAAGLVLAALRRPRR
ncbi:MAG: PEP-CTERM sorting domain-containing protein [Opitutaceae bacterium]|jgi:autotransporter-associated beta strand protein|nr:PEP-CTERM sorting domain-containing protein [Opitutaceae bacterium]